MIRAAISTVAATMMWLIGSVAVAIEEPAFRAIEQDGAFELREYAPYLLAETSVDADFMEAGNVAFGRLFRYISGANVSQRKLAMTAPVTQSAGEKISMTAPVRQIADGRQFRVGFIVPSQYTLATVPQPSDPRVKIRRVEGGLVAVWRYSGRWTEANFREHEQLLNQEIVRRGLLATGAASIARYNSPFALPMFRRNEVQVTVSRAAPAPR
jgi:hypothetical protein